MLSINGFYALSFCKGFSSTQSLSRVFNFVDDDLTRHAPLFFGIYLSGAVLDIDAPYNHSFETFSEAFSASVCCLFSFEADAPKR